MNVGKLIEILATYPPEKEVYIDSNECDKFKDFAPCFPVVGTRRTFNDFTPGPVYLTGYPVKDRAAVEMNENEEMYSVAQIREAYEKHGREDDWGVKAFYDDSLINALRGEYDEDDEE